MATYAPTRKIWISLPVDAYERLRAEAQVAERTVNSQALVILLAHVGLFDQSAVRPAQEVMSPSGENGAAQAGAQK